MKITKKILISALAISPLTTLAFIPSVVRPKEVETHCNDYTKDIYFEYDSAIQPEDFVDIIEELIKEFDIYDASTHDIKSLASKIEAKRNELNKKIIVNEDRIKAMEETSKKEYHGCFLDKNEIKLRKFCVENLNYKLKLLEEVENKLLSKIMKEDYRKSMKKHYSSDALAYTIAEMAKAANELEGEVKIYENSRATKGVEEEKTRWLFVSISAQMEILNKLNAIKEMLQKHFTVNKDIIKKYSKLVY